MPIQVSAHAYHLPGEVPLSERAEPSLSLSHGLREAERPVYAIMTLMQLGTKNNMLGVSETQTLYLATRWCRHKPRRFKAA